MLNPRYPRRWSPGNVETSPVRSSMRSTARSGVLAASQGTMNNFTFGDERTQYYETICGGAGAGPGLRRRDAVQTHMTNSRLTDPGGAGVPLPGAAREVGIRRGAADGARRWRESDGAVRRVRFLEPTAARSCPPAAVWPFLAWKAARALGRNSVGAGGRLRWSR